MWICLNISLRSSNPFRNTSIAGVPEIQMIITTLTCDWLASYPGSKMVEPGYGASDWYYGILDFWVLTSAITIFTQTERHATQSDEQRQYERIR